MSQLITGVFHSRSRAEQAVDELMRLGFARNDISMLMSETTRGREFGVHESTKAPEGAAAGATIGGVLGAIAAGLAAIGTIVIPGLQLVAVGPVVASLAGLGAGAAAGGLTGALIGLGVPEHEAKFYQEEIERGGILIGVYSHKDQVKLAKDVMESAGAEHVH